MTGAEGKILTGIRVLCVDDSPDALLLSSVVLRKYGADVTSCASAEIAIDRLKIERYDIVVSDIMMPPGLDGYDLAHNLRKMEKDDPDRMETPMVAVSGNASTPSKKKRFADFQVYMLKPFDHARLVYVVERLAEADGDAVSFGTLGSWEANGAAKSAAEAILAAAGATKAAEIATRAAATGEITAALATMAANETVRAASKGEAAAQIASKVAKEAAKAATEGEIAAAVAGKAAEDAVQAAKALGVAGCSPHLLP